VLDVGCGPGTNRSQFGDADYLGLDINERYIEHARRRYGGDFRAVDVTRYAVPDAERYDFILVNSFLHHLPTPEVERMWGGLFGRGGRPCHRRAAEPGSRVGGDRRR